MKRKKIINKTEQEIETNCDHWFMFYQQGDIREEAKEFIKNNLESLIKANEWGTIGIKTALLDTKDIYKCVYCRKEIEV